MNILITGGTGFIGKALCPSLLAKNHNLWVLTRNIEKAKQALPYSAIHFIDNLQDIEKEQIDAVINLAGAPIAQRWTLEYKALLKESRLNLTENLIKWIEKLPQRPKVLISGSAVGFYGPQDDQSLSETSKYQDSFSHELCSAWEKAALKAKSLGVRVCCLRTGIVLGKNGGALERMRLPFLLGMGGPIGSGHQWMSWIHIDDMVQIIQYILEHEELEGPVNATSPHPVINKEFAKKYAKALHRPAILCAPKLPLQIIFGQMADELLLTGQRVIPTKLLNAGFAYHYPELEIALTSIEKG